MKFLKWLSVVLILLIIVYFLGPEPSSPKYDPSLPKVPSAATQLEKYISDRDASHKLKADNEARIVWQNDSLKQKTDYAIVYLHGFSASREEGSPVHTDFAKKFGCNLF